MEKNTNKKLFAGVLALSCAFVLGACDPVEALPENYKDPILQYIAGGDVETDDNIMGKIYDSISSNKNEKALQIILDEIATKKFGTYTEIVAAKEDPTNYINSHQDMFVREGDTEALKTLRFENFFNDIQDRVSEAFYNLITSSTYNDPVTGMFDEEKLYDKLAEDLWDLQAKPAKFAKFYVTSELTKKNALSKLSKTDNGTSIYSYDETKDITGKLSDGVTEVSHKARGYIEKKVFPQILKDKLVEEYIYNNNQSVLGRSYARKVNYVKVNYDDSSLNYIKYIVNDYVNTFIYTSEGEEQLNFDSIDKAILGFDGINPLADTTENPLIKLSEVVAETEYAPYSEAYLETSYKVNKDYFVSLDGKPTQTPMVKVNALTDANEFITLDGMRIFPETDFELYADTKLGKLLDSYNKALRAKDAGLNPSSEDKAELDKFANGKSLADSLRDKILDLAKEDNTTDGWYVKNGGVSELPSALRDRLFNINVANDLESGYVKESQSDGTLGNYRYKDGDPTKAKLDKVPYARNIEGRKFIMPSQVADFDTDNENFVYKDTSGKAFYICQVLEAPSTPKLNKDSSKAYKNGADVDLAKIETISREVAKVLSTKDTYITNAYTKYLEIYKDSFSFGDTSTYEYFKGQYPDLFEDED